MSEHTPNEIVIDHKQESKDYFKDLVHYRELFYFFAWRDILVRYKQAFFGVAWALIRPILNMVVFAMLFGKIASLPSDHVNYALFVLAGMLPWQLCSSSATDTCVSLVSNASLVSKVYFPRMIVPIAQIIVHLVDFAITTLLLLIMGLIIGGLNFATLLFFPLFLVLTLLFCVGTGLWLSAITVQYRDFKIVVPFIVQFGMFISPVGYGTFLIPERWQWLYFLNPMAGIIDGFRWTFFGISYETMWISIGMSVIVTSIIFITGLIYFRKMERTFADKI